MKSVCDWSVTLLWDESAYFIFLRDYFENDGVTVPSNVGYPLSILSLFYSHAFGFDESRRVLTTTLFGLDIFTFRIVGWILLMDLF